MRVKKQRGNGVTFRRKDSDFYWIAYTAHGVRHRESAKSDKLADATDLLAQRTADIVMGKPVGASVEKTTLLDLEAMLLDQYAVDKRRSARRAREAFAHLFEFFTRDARANAITSDRVTKYRKHRQEQNAAGATVDIELAMLRHSFKLALEAKRVKFMPTIKLLKPNNARKGFFEPHEYAAVLAQLPDHLKPVIQTAYITGWRTASELLLLEWRRVDFAAGCIKLDAGESKTGEAREFPMTPELRTLLEAQRDWVHEIEKKTATIITWVFVHPDGSSIKTFHDWWKKACKLAKVEGKLVHDFRRTAIRNSTRAGISEQVAMELSGHKTRTVFERYNITSADDRRDAAVKLAAYHAQLAQSPQPAQPTKLVELRAAKS